MTSHSENVLTRRNGPLPLVSVVTATFNAASTLAECLESVAAQDYPEIEHIVIDGGSTDGTLDLLREKQHQLGCWISEPDHGVFDAWNKGIALSHGRWIAFLGADDVYLPGAITAYINLAEEAPEAVYLSSQVRWIGPRGKPRTIGQPWQWPRFQRFLCTAHVGSMHHHDLFQRIGTFDTSYRIVGDFELLLRAGADLQAAFLPQVTAQMRCGGLSDSSAALAEAARAKIQSGARSPARTRFDLLEARAKRFARQSLRLA